MSIANQLKQARKESGLTQKQLADKCGITRTTISKIENGYYNPTVIVLEKLALGLGKEFSLI